MPASPFKQIKLILMRHGQSEWNRLNLFTGWVDIPLSAQGVEESIAGGKKIAHLPIDAIYTSSLIRAQMTALLAMMHHSSGRVPCIQHQGEKGFEVHSQKSSSQMIPMYCAPELNERMYGELQGLNKQETKDEFGEAQVQIWRRSFDQAPPGGESLQLTAERAVPYFKEHILPSLKKGKHILVAAHGNSLRAIMMFLDNLSSSEVVHLEIPTGEPIIYTFEGDRWKKDG